MPVIVERAASHAVSVDFPVSYTHLYYVTDAAQLENVIRKVQSISSINWNNYKITANDEVYQNISSALSDTGTLITTLIVVITAVSMASIKMVK